MEKILESLRADGVDPGLLEGVSDFRNRYPLPEGFGNRLPSPPSPYYGAPIWNLAIAAVLSGSNLLLAGPKATGKNILAENLALLFGRPIWNVSFHINVDAGYLMGTDSFDGQRVYFKPGPITQCAAHGGFGILDEINMARNEALAVLHSTLDFRRIIDVAGYDPIVLQPATRFIGTMNYGYAGTRDLNEALASRFAIVDMPYISPDDLERLLDTSFPGMKASIRDQFVRLFYEIEEKAKAGEISERALDLRGLLDALGLIKQGVSGGDALTMCIVNKTFDPYERSLVQDVVEARIPKKLGRADIWA